MPQKYCWCLIFKPMTRFRFLGKNYMGQVPWILIYIMKNSLCGDLCPNQPKMSIFLWKRKSITQWSYYRSGILYLFWSQFACNWRHSNNIRSQLICYLITVDAPNQAYIRITEYQYMITEIIICQIHLISKLTVLDTKRYHLIRYMTSLNSLLKLELGSPSSHLFYQNVM